MPFDVNVKIDLAKPVGSVGSWYPLLYVVDASAEADQYGEYTDLAEIATAGYTDKSDVYKAATLMLMQENTPSKFAVLKQKSYSLETFKPYLEKGWRQVIVVGENASIATMATDLETVKDKMLFVTVADKAQLKYTTDRTFVVYHTSEDNAAAAVVGATAGYEAGSFTYKNIIIKGVAPVEISDTELEEIHEAGAITIVEKAGDIVTSEGKVASGEYADIIDSNDYVIQNIEYRIQKLFNTNKKVPYTNAGIAMLEAAVLGVLKNAYSMGIIAEGDDGNPLYSVNFVLRSGTTEADRAARKYPYGRFTYTLAGAIHTADVIGTVTV